MHDVARGVTFLGGLGFLAYGCWLIYPPLAWIIVGAYLMALPILTGRKP